MSKNKDRARTFNLTNVLGKHYETLFEINGANSKGVDWGDTSKHLIRLESMLDLLGKNFNKNDILLDVGCGYGELLKVLKKNESSLAKSYIGFDVSEKMINYALSNIENNKKFYVSNIYDWDKQASIVFCCGIFTKKLTAANNEMEKLLASFFEMCLRVKAKNVIFNTMSPLCDYFESSLYYPSPNLIFNLISKYWGYNIKNLKITNSHLRYEFIWSFEVVND